MVNALTKAIEAENSTPSFRADVPEKIENLECLYREDSTGRLGIEVAGIPDDQAWWRVCTFEELPIWEERT